MNVKKKKLNELVKEYYETGHFSNELYWFVVQATEQISRQNNFKQYSDVDEFILIAQHKIFLSLIKHKFNPYQGSFYSYCTSIIYNSFISEIKKFNNRKKTILLEDMNYEESEQAR